MRYNAWTVSIITLLFIVVVGFIVWGVVLVNTPKPDVITINDYSWEREIVIQELFTYEGEGWDVPVGAYVEDQYDEIYEYDEEGYPVYKTYYYYYEEEWERTRSVVTEGYDKSPYWGDVKLWRGEREGYRTQYYRALAVNSEGKTKTYKFSIEDWMRLEIDKSYEVNTYISGFAELLR